MKKLVISHGDKGGVGKSIFAMLATEYALNQNIPVALVEGDIKVGDVTERYAGVDVDGLTGFVVDLDKSGSDAENAITTLFRNLEDSGADMVVMNSPANAHKVWDTHAGIIVPVAEDLGYDICTAWMVGVEDASARLANESRICQMSHRKMAVVNRHDSQYDPDFVWFTRPAYQKAWVDSGGMVSEIPNLASRVATRLKEHQGITIAEMTGKDSPLHLVDRQIIKNWMTTCWNTALVPLLGGNSDGN